MDHDLTTLWEAARRRRMSAPLLLFVGSHAPLTFLAGQALYMVAPLADLLGWDAPHTWAARLSRPQAATLPEDADTP
jgi:hypothetical protein